MENTTPIENKGNVYDPYMRLLKDALSRVEHDATYVAYLEDEETIIKTLQEFEMVYTECKKQLTHELRSGKNTEKTRQAEETMKEIETLKQKFQALLLDTWDATRGPVQLINALKEAIEKREKFLYGDV